jgi:hypothetical protein
MLLLLCFISLISLISHTSPIESPCVNWSTSSPSTITQHHTTTQHGSSIPARPFTRLMGSSSSSSSPTTSGPTSSPSQTADPPTTCPSPPTSPSLTCSASHDSPRRTDARSFRSRGRVPTGLRSSSLAWRLLLARFFRDSVVATIAYRPGSRTTTPSTTTCRTTIRRTATRRTTTRRPSCAQRRGTTTTCCSRCPSRPTHPIHHRQRQKSPATLRPVPTTAASGLRCFQPPRGRTFKAWSALQRGSTQPETPR